jgi:hypothetical protein
MRLVSFCRGSDRAVLISLPMRRAFANRVKQVGTNTEPTSIPVCAKDDTVTPPRILRAYRLTRYWVAGTEIRIGRRVPDVLFERLGTPRGTLLTAWNPLSRRMATAWNERMQRRLRCHLRRAVALDAEGSLHRWHEAMLLAGGPPQLAIRLARRFRQSAVVQLRRGAKAQLILL